MPDYARSRYRMVAEQIARRGIRDLLVLDAMRRVPREAFVEPGLAAFAYDDRPLPIGAGQTISQPYVVALMIAAAAIGKTARVLEVGTGSGYAAALLSRIAAHVHGIERHPALAAAAAARLERLGYRNVDLRVGDGTLGWPEAAPFDAILVAAGAPAVPAALKAQLVLGGRLVIPVGTAVEQALLRVVRRSRTEFDEETLGAVTFVPLVGSQAWPDEAGTRPGRKR